MVSGSYGPTIWEFRQVLLSRPARRQALACAALALQLAAPAARADDAPVLPDDEVEVPDAAGAQAPAVEPESELETAEEETESVISEIGIKAFDAVIVRPLGAVATVTGEEQGAVDVRQTGA